MKKWGVRLIVFAGLLCLMGCGREENGSASGEQGVASAGTVSTGAESLYINELIPLRFEDKAAAEKKFFYDTYGSSLYVL